MIRHTDGIGDVSDGPVIHDGDVKPATPTPKKICEGKFSKKLLTYSVYFKHDTIQIKF